MGCRPIGAPSCGPSSTASATGWASSGCPAYAPELNPVEGLWAKLKDLELANLPTTSLAEVAEATEQGIQRVCKHQDLVVGFLAHTGLSLDP
jgi:hypothetical protein